MRAILVTMNEPARRKATYEDVLATPEHLVAEVIQGVLYQRPRPASLHSAAASVVGEELGPPFKRGKGIHFGADIVVPDVASWRLVDRAARSLSRGARARWPELSHRRSSGRHCPSTSSAIRCHRVRRGRAVGALTAPPAKSSHDVT